MRLWEVDRMKVMVKGGILKVSPNMSRLEIHKEQLTDGETWDLFSLG
jgi:hypothetical protein